MNSFSFRKNDNAVGRGPYSRAPAGGVHHHFSLTIHPNRDTRADPNPAAGEGIKNDFIVNNQAGTVPADYSYTSPTVALTAETAHRGRFIIAWNSQAPTSFSGDEIHGQYFDTDGRPMGCEFRMTKNFSNTKSRILSASARHTLAYAANGDVALAYTKKDVNSDTDREVWLTIIPDGTAEDLDAAVPYCCRGDVNRDGEINGIDIFAFKNLILKVENPETLSAVEVCPADVDQDGHLSVDDIPPFAALLLEGATCGGPPSRGIADCNANEIPDANDIADGTSQDCNHNFIPDECDINTNDPDGNELVSADVNANSVPDECEPDCNVNSVPDAWDITQMTSTDVNTNGVPDECEPDCNNNNYPDDYDIAMSTSADCNVNGIPDECETDCNENGVPDDCDIDPADPDGNQQVSADCNADGMPDECNLTLPPPYGSFDCNENGILDECDIASAFSEDANENGVPDECEESGLFGGDSMMGGPEEAPVDEEAAWEAFYEWSFSQCWGPQCALSTSEQFQLYLDKLAELGLSMEDGGPTP